MLYHYTDRLSAVDIRADRLIRAYPTILYRDVLAQGPSHTTEPIVWLSSNPVLEGTVVSKMQLGGWPPGLVADLYRFVLSDGYGGDLGLGEYTDLAGIDPEWWEWAVRTGAMAGSHYTTWRIVQAPIPAPDWQGVEVLSLFREDGTTVWTPLAEIP